MFSFAFDDPPLPLYNKRSDLELCPREITQLIQFEAKEKKKYGNPVFDQLQD
jgi:hypothetical protein